MNVNSVTEEYNSRERGLLSAKERSPKKPFHSGRWLCPFDCRLIRRPASDNLHAMQNLTSNPIVSVLLVMTRTFLLVNSC